MPGPMLHTASRVIMELLVDHGFGTDPDDGNGLWPIFVGVHPDKPDDTIKITDTIGDSFGYTEVDRERQGNDGIQIMLRCADPRIGGQKLQEIAIFLDRLGRTFVEVFDTEGTGTPGTRYLVDGVNRTTQVLSIGADVPQGKRQLFTTNALCTIRMCC